MKLNDLQNKTPWTLARRAEKMNPSVIREILKVTEQPGVLSLARLAPVLGVSLGALVGEVGEQPLRVVVEGLVARHGLPEVAEAVAEHVSVAIRGKA